MALKSKNTTAYSRVAGRPPHYSYLYETERLNSTDGIRRFNSCVHYKVNPYSGPWVYDINRNEQYLVTDFAPGFNQVLGWCLDVHNIEASRLVNSDLQSSTKAGLIQNILELDDTLANFTIKYWKELKFGSAYAATKFGTRPMIGDLQNILSQLGKVNSMLKNEQQTYDSSTTKSLSTTIVDGGDVFSVTATVRTIHQGTIYIPDEQQTKKWLDYVGFHPDVSTMWDLIPLSFVVDWFIPIGKYIDSFKSRGWVDEAIFSGSHSTKITFDVQHASTIPGFLVSPCKYTGKVYRRGLSTNHLKVMQPTFHEINSKLVNVTKSKNLPTLTQLGDTAYLAALIAKSKK